MASRYPFRNQILELLYPVGPQGLKLRAIVMHIYNGHAELFDNSLSFDYLYESVRQYLTRQCNLPDSAICKVRGQYGRYALNYDSSIVQLFARTADWAVSDSGQQVLDFNQVFDSIEDSCHAHPSIEMEQPLLFEDDALNEKDDDLNAE